MAKKNRIGLQFSGFKEMAEKFDGLQGDLKKTTEDALRKSKAVVVANLLKATQKSNYPAHGEYSTGTTRHSISIKKGVNWEGTMASIPVGISLWDKNGEKHLTSIFLMYGTPRMQKVQVLYDAVYGSKTKTQIRKIQKETFQEAIKKKMEG